jgi:hypothetical protein
MVTMSKCSSVRSCQKWQDTDMLNKAHIDANIINEYREESTNFIDIKLFTKLYYILLWQVSLISLNPDLGISSKSYDGIWF